MINRDNYEEFFMMYADGELSPADRQAVDRFVTENPDLASELALFEQLQLPADPVSFTGKHSLYRFEAKDITAANYEEQFLLYVDNELDESAKEKVEVFVLQNPGYQDAFTLLKQTKLPVETVVFANKASLYRREEKRPVVYMRWVRLAVAAVFIGAAVLVWTLLPKDPSPVSNLAKTNMATPGNKPASGDAQPNPAISVTKDDRSGMAAVVKKEKFITGTTAPIQQNIAQLVNEGANIQSNPVTANRATQGEDKLPAASTVNSAAEERPLVTDRVIAANFSDESSETMKRIPHPDEEGAASGVHSAVYRELDTDDEKKSLYLGSLEINKDKLRGFFRKAGSIFRSKAKQQEEDNRTESATPAGSRTLK